MYHYLKLAVYAICLITWTVAVTDCLKSNNENKPRWIAFILLIPVLGPLCYFRFAQGRFVSEI